jgi:CheY-like chemotaxis protein
VHLGHRHVLSKDVVVAEDNPAARRRLVHLLHEAGMENVVETTNAGDALWAVRDAPPDVLALDLSLPDRDGLELAAAVRRGGYTGTVLVVSSDRSDAVLAAARRAQAVVVHKPVTAFALDEALNGPPPVDEDLPVADSPAVLLPSTGALRTLLGELFGGTVDLSPGHPVIPRPGNPAAVAVYLRPRLQTGAVLVADLPMALALAAAVGVGTAHAVGELHGRGAWPSAMTADLHESAAVLGNAFTLRSSRSLQLYAVHAPGDRLDPLTAAAVGTIRPRLDLEVETPLYGRGRLSLVVPPTR